MHSDRRAVGESIVVKTVASIIEFQTVVRIFHLKPFVPNVLSENLQVRMMG